MHHISKVFKNQKAREEAIKKELEKREKGIYLYIISPSNKKQMRKPVLGSVLDLKL